MAAMRTAAVLLVALCAWQAEALYGAKSEVKTVDPAQLKKLLAGDGVVLLEVFAPWCGHCRNLVPEMDKAAKALKGVVTVAAVDADTHKDVAQRYEVQGFPTLMLFGDDRSKPIPVNARTAKELVSASMREATKIVDARLGGKKSSSGSSGGSKGSTDVVVLNESNFEEQVLKSDDIWMVEFYAPWCGHCKTLAPEWAAAATQLKGTRAHLGMVDATQHQSLASKYGVQGYPTIKVFATSKSSPEDYQGARSAQGIVQYAIGKLDEVGFGPEVNEAVSADALKKECLDKGQICVVAVLPHVMDTGASGRNKYIESVLEAAKEMRMHNYAFVWISGGAQSAIEQMFGIEYNYPTFVAISMKKKRYFAHKGAFSTEGIVKSLKKAASTKPIKDEDFLSRFVKTEPWDGKDYSSPDDDEEL